MKAQKPNRTGATPPFDQMNGTDAPAYSAVFTAKPRHQLIGEQPFFSGMKEEYLHTLASLALPVHFEPNQLVFRQGDPANRFYLILRGKVALEAADNDGRPIRFMTLGPGDDLGWSWLFAPYYLHFSAYVLEPTDAIFFYGTRLREECERNDALGYEMMKRVAKVVVRRLETSQRNWTATRTG